MKFAGSNANFGSQVTVIGNDSASNHTDKKFIEDLGLFFCEPSFSTSSTTNGLVVLPQC